MNTKWNLDNIYTSVNSKDFKADMAKYKELIAMLNLWCNENLTPDTDKVTALEEYINKKNQLMSYDRLIMYANLVQTTDTTNTDVAKAIDSLETISAQLTYHETAIIDFVKNIDNIEDIIEKSTLLSEHRYFILQLKAKAEHTLSSKEEAVISKLKNTGSLLWEKQWNQLTSTLMVDYKGEKLPLSQIRNLAYDSSEEVRKTAYEAEISAYGAIEQPAAFCMNGIKGEVITTSEMRGYSSPLEMTLLDSRIDEDILKAMFTAVEMSLDKLQNYFLIKSKALGHNGALPFYDLFAPIAKSDKSYTPEEARDFVLKCFYDFSEDLGSFAEYAFNNRWLDVMPSKGKVGGAYCETIHSVKESRILLNFGGAFDDVITMAHELGHAFHNTRLFNLSELNSFYPMPIAETASTFCESIVVNAALKNASDKDRLIILENDIMGLTQCVVDIYSRFLFEDSVFNKRKEGTLSSEELSQLMLSAQKKAYGKGLDPDCLHKYMWVCKPHYYDAEFNYYNFPYAFGALLSKGLYALYKKMGNEFLPLYDSFLSASSTRPLAEVARLADIDLYSVDFWLEGLKGIINEIDELGKMLYNKQLI